MQRGMLLAVATASLLLVSALAAAQEGRRGSGPGVGRPGAGAITFVDAHDHIRDDLDPARLIAAMDRLGVSKVVLMAQAKSIPEAAALALRAHERYPDRVIPFIGINFLQTIVRADVEALERALVTGKFPGVGEFLAHHNAVSGARARAPEVRVPLDTPVVDQFLCVVAKHNAVLVLHMETTLEGLAALERALQRHPDLKLVWAHQNHVKTMGGSRPEHARQADPARLAQLFDRFPNLFADLSPGDERRFLAGGDRSVPPPWLDLYERYSDRFAVGLDNAFTMLWEDQGLGATLISSFVKDWLAQLTPATRAKFASENIARILAMRTTATTTCN